MAFLNEEPVGVYNMTLGFWFLDVCTDSTSRNASNSKTVMSSASVLRGVTCWFATIEVPNHLVSG